MAIPGTISAGAAPRSSRPQYLLVRRTLSYTEIDGIFGPVTAEAVAEFRRNTQGLTVDGIIGPATWTALGGDGAQPPVLRPGSHGTVVEQPAGGPEQGPGRRSRRRPIRCWPPTGATGR